jgi:signal transduction histidine kinase
MKNINSTIDKLRSLNLSNEELFEAFQNILDEKEIELNYYKEKYEKLNVIIDLIPNTISWVNKDMTYFGANKALADACQLTPSDFIGRPLGFHTKEKFFYDFAIDLFESPQDTIYRELESKIGGVNHSFLVSGTKLIDKTKAVVIGVDITELKSLQGHVSFTEKLATLGEMFAGIIHDINNPLMMIDASVKKIKRLNNDPEIVEILNKIELSSSKVAKIIKGIKIYIRHDEEVPHQIEKLGSILDDASTICENKLKEHSVTLTIDPKLLDLPILCNSTQLFQVFVNLMTNAVDAISKLDTKFIKINLESDSNESFHRIHFIDSGSGIPLDLQDKIFHAFYTTKGKGVGTGLGLSLCKKILESHKATIAIIKDAPNTTFEITLPK